MLARLSQFIEYKHISVRAFEMSIGASDGMIRRAIKNNTDIQSKWLAVIAENYPDVNIYWLITGKGDMIKGDSVIFFPPKPPKAPPEPTVIYKSDPKDAEIIELQREQIQLLKEKLADFKKDHIGYVRSTPIPPAAAPASAKVDPLVKVPDQPATRPSKRP